MKIQDVPKFGNLKGVKVLLHATNIAAPFAASLMAENGATVLFLESTLTPDTGRVNDPPYLVPQERRNMLGMNLNLLTAEGKEIFLKLIKEIDIIFEGNKGGTYDKWGLSDEFLWKHNPKLVIVHVSGFGQNGVAEYVTRPCYDAIAQAFGGYTFQNGVPGGEAIKAGQYAGDYITSLFACWSALAAYINAQKTGKGDSIDVAMYETLWKVQANVSIEYFRDGIIETRCGNNYPKSLCSGNFLCKDGEYVVVSSFGQTIMSNVIKFFNLENEYPKFYPVALKGTPEGERLNEIMMKYCLEHDSYEVEKAFTEAGIPASRIYNIQTIQDNPHVQARELFIEWEDPHFGRLKGVGLVPKFKNHPGKIWRGAPLYGMDTEDILKELGYSQEQIENFYEKKVIVKTPKNGGYNC